MIFFGPEFILCKKLLIRLVIKPIIFLGEINDQDIAGVIGSDGLGYPTLKPKNPLNSHF